MISSLLERERSLPYDELRTPRSKTMPAAFALAVWRSESVMRSNQVHRALAQGINRFEVCQLVSKGVRATHIVGSRFEDTINSTLECLGNHNSDDRALNPASQKDGAKALGPAA